MLSKNELKRLAAYKMQKNCDAEGVFVVEGVRLCQEALNSDFNILEICALEDYAQELSEKHPSNEVKIVSDEQLQRLSSMQSPNKVWMLVERKTASGFVLPRPHGQSPINSQSSLPIVLSLDCLQNPGNMGTILRTADWFGIRNVVCSVDTVSCYNPKVVQASMGAIFRTEVSYCNLEDFLTKASREGYEIYGATLNGQNLYSSTLKTPAVLVVGNEGKGLSANVDSLLTSRITIPNIGRTCESLNAAVATAILCSEFCRQAKCD